MNVFPNAFDLDIEARSYIEKSLFEISKMTVKKQIKRNINVQTIQPGKKEIEPEELKEEKIYDTAGAQQKYKQGLVSYAHGKRKEAIQFWEIAVRLDPSNEKIWKTLEKAKEELGGIRK